jgi:DNA-binding MarR family transcriptional regulator
MDQQPITTADTAKLAEEVRAACLGMRVTRLHRRIARVFEQALQPVGLTLPQMEIITELIAAAGPVKPAALAGLLMVERSTLSRNLAAMQEQGWVAAVETSPTGRVMSVAVAEPGISAFLNASAAWRGAQSSMETVLGPAAVSTLNQWLGLEDTPPTSADCPAERERAS